MIDEELRKYYEARFDMFASVGWIQLIEDIDARIDAISSIKGIKDFATLNIRQGELDALEWLKSLPNVSSAAYEELQGE